MRNKRYGLVQEIYDKEARKWKIVSTVLDWETLQFQARKTRCIELCIHYIYYGFINREGKKVYCSAGGRLDDVCEYFLSGSEL